MRPVLAASCFVYISRFSLSAVSTQGVQQRPILCVKTSLNLNFRIAVSISSLDIFDLPFMRKLAAFFFRLFIFVYLANTNPIKSATLDHLHFSEALVIVVVRVAKAANNCRLYSRLLGYLLLVKVGSDVPLQFLQFWVDVAVFRDNYVGETVPFQYLHLIQYLRILCG